MNSEYLKERFGKYLETLQEAKVIDTTLNPLTGRQQENVRVVDMYDRGEIDQHVAHFMQHSAARKIEPSLDVVLDFLYGKKTYTEKDDFVRIERLIEMISENKVYPMLIVEVLRYALSVEKAAIDVLEEHFDKVGTDKHLKALQSALATRLSLENEKARDEE